MRVSWSFGNISVACENIWRQARDPQVPCKKSCVSLNIMAAARLIGSLYIWSEASGATGQAWRPEGGQRAPGGPQGMQLEEIGESRARHGGEPARGRESL